MTVLNGKPGIVAALFLCAALSLCSDVAAASSQGYGASAPVGMEVEWQSVPSGISPVKAWVKDDVVLLESGDHSLVCIRRSDGVHMWRCELENALRFAPSVSRNNVLVNVDNWLVAIEKSGGNIRWKLDTKFLMSNEAMLIDPALYPKEYTNQWQNLEAIYVAGWDSRIHALWSRGKVASFYKGLNVAGDFLAPNFDLSQNFVKANKGGAITITPFKLRDDILYYTADNNLVCSFTRDGEERESYYLQGQPCTEITVTAGSLFIGAQDYNVYCLDRLTMKKKWAFAAGKLAQGVIFADEPATPLVYVPLADGKIQALRVTPSRAAKKGEFETPERMTESWNIAGDGIVTAGPMNVYVGSGKTGDRAYKSVSAINKVTGATVWSMSADQILSYQNNWSNSASTARIYAVNAGGTVTSYKEIKRETGIQIAKLPTEVEPEQPKMKVIKKKEEPTSDPLKPDAPAKEEPKKEEPKKEEPKKEEAPKAEAPKADAPKADAPKADEEKK